MVVEILLDIELFSMYSTAGIAIFASIIFLKIGGEEEA